MDYFGVLYFKCVYVYLTTFLQSFKFHNKPLGS